MLSLILYAPMNCTRFLFLIGFALFAAACQPVVANRGNLLEADRLEQIKPGETDQAAVQKLLGPPTMTGTFDKKFWYYNGKRTERTAFFDPETVDERTVVIHFDDAGLVDDVKQVDPKTAIAIAPEDRRTPTVGESLTVMDQVRESLSHPGLPGSIGGRKPGQVLPGGH